MTPARISAAILAFAVLALCGVLYGTRGPGWEEPLARSFDRFVTSDEDTFLYLIGDGKAASRIYDPASARHLETTCLVVSRKELLFQDGIVRATGPTRPDKGLLFANVGRWYGNERSDDLRRDLVAEAERILARSRGRGDR